MVTDGSSGLPLIPRKAFHQDPSHCWVRLSPDGSQLAWLSPHEGALNIWTAPAERPADKRLLTRGENRPVVWLQWSECSRFIFFLQDETGDENYHLYALEVSTAACRDLTPFPAVSARLVMHSLVSPDQVLLAVNDRDKAWHDVWRVELGTGERRLVYRNVDRISGFVADHQGRLRLARRASADFEGDELLLFEESGLVLWQRIPFEDAFTTWVCGFDASGETLFWISSIGRDTNALLKVDLRSDAETLLAQHPAADLLSLIVDPKSFEPISVIADPGRQERILLDPSAEAIVEVLAERFGEGVETSIVSLGRDSPLALVSSWGPADPGRYFLLNRDTREIELLFHANDALRDLPFAPMRVERVRMSDGLEVVCYLTLPSDGDGTRPPPRPLPLVLTVHGGPWARDHWCFDAQHQWLANRGYAVLSVNYRGSTGFGKAYLNAGDREHGRRILQDLLDSVDWATAQGIADPDRIAIMGLSYGGYCAFAAAAFAPDRFCCSIPIVGITDLITFIEQAPPYWTGYRQIFDKRFGEVSSEEGRALLRSRSPLYFTEQIRTPMLIGHGANDVRCTLEQSETMVRALEGQGVPVTFVVFPDEGHGLYKPRNRIAFNAMIEAFLAQHLGGCCEPVGDDFDGSSHEIRAGQDFLQDASA